MESNGFSYTDCPVEIKPTKKDNHHHDQQIKEKNKNFDMSQRKQQHDKISISVNSLY